MSPTLLHLRPVRGFLRQHCLLSVPSAGKRIALTFDDGPSPRNTPPLLELLARKGIRSTFFVVGKRMARFSSIAAAVHSEGHELGNHGYHHFPLAALPDGLVRREIRRTGEWIVSVTGENPRWFRPPMGWFTQRNADSIEDMGYRIVLGTIHPEDSRRPGTETLLRRIRPRIEPGAIVILHDGGWRVGVDRSQTLETVDRLTDELGGEGSEFTTVGGLLDGSEAAP